MNRQLEPRATARLVTSPRLQKRRAGSAGGRRLGRRPCHALLVGGLPPPAAVAGSSGARARIIAKALTSIPTGRRPAAVIGLRRCPSPPPAGPRRRPPPSAVRRRSRGSARAPASRSPRRPAASGCARRPGSGSRRRPRSRSSIKGSRSVLTTTRWLAMPTRTLRPSFDSAKRSLSAAASASGSVTSPSRVTPEPSGATPERPGDGDPLRRHLGRGDAAGLDVEPDDGGGSACAQLRHAEGRPIRTRPTSAIGARA